MEFPQPTRPINSSVDENIIVSNQYYSQEKPAAHDHVSPVMATTTGITLKEEEEQEEGEDYEKLRSILMEVYEKIPEKIRHQLNLEGIWGQMINMRKGSQESLRGLEGSDGRIKEYLLQRLERFKIRTLNPTGEVPKDETKL